MYDAVSISSTERDPEFWKSFLGLDRLKWEEGKSRYYDKRLYSSTISIHYNDKNNPSRGTWLEMMGQGCRIFEDLGTGDFESLFCLVKHDPDNFKITRLDIAFDDHTGLLDLEQLSADTRNQSYISKFRRWQTVEGSDGRSVNLGSQQSDFYVRIYDKAMERGFEDQHWVRMEFQLRDDRAGKWLRQPQEIGERFAGVLKNYLRYVEPSVDGNRWRWPMKQYWADLIGAAEKISLYVKPGIDYNLSKLNGYVFQQAGNAIAAAMQIYGPKSFEEKLNDRNTVGNPKYDKLVDLYRRGPAIPVAQNGG